MVSRLETRMGSVTVPLVFLLEYTRLCVTVQVLKAQQEKEEEDFLISNDLQDLFDN